MFYFFSSLAAAAEFFSAESCDFVFFKVFVDDGEDEQAPNNVNLFVPDTHGEVVE